MSGPLEPYQMTAQLERIGYAVLPQSELAQLRAENAEQAQAIKTPSQTTHLFPKLWSIWLDLSNP